MVADLKKSYDLLKTEKKRKERAFAAMFASVNAREECDTYTSECISAGEKMMEALQGRLDKLQHALSRCKALSSSYEFALQLCKEFPAKDKVYRVSCGATSSRTRREPRASKLRLIMINVSQRRWRMI